MVTAPPEVEGVVRVPNCQRFASEEPHEGKSHRIAALRRRKKRGDDLRDIFVLRAAA